MACKNCPYVQQAHLNIDVQNIPHKKIMLIGEAPTKKDIARQSVLVSDGGQVIYNALSRFGYTSKDIYSTYAVKCLPKKDKKQITKASLHCKETLFQEIYTVRPEIIITMGATAYNILNPQGQYKDFVGTVHFIEHLGYYILPIMHPAQIIANDGDINILNIMLITLQNFLEKGEIKDSGKTEFQIIKYNVEFEQMLQFLATKKVVAADIETTGLEYDDELLNMGIAYDKNKVFVLTKPFMTSWRLKQLFELPLIWIWQNGKFDIVRLKNKGITNAKMHHDIMLQHHVLTRARGWHGLEKMALIYLGANAYKEKADRYIRSKEGFGSAPEDIINERVGVDADYTLQLHQLFYPYILNNKNHYLCYHTYKIPTANLLSNIELTGLHASIDKIKALQKELSIEITHLQALIQNEVRYLWDRDLYMIETNAKSAPIEFNPDSVQQLAWVLYDRLSILRVGKKGRSTEKDILKPLIEKYPLVDYILQLRSAQKELSTYVEAILPKLDANDRIHTTFTMTETATGRLSSKEPNIQNIKDSMKSIYTAPEGRIIINADFKQAELRTMAFLAESEYMAEVFKQRRDLHGEMAEKLYGKDYTKQERKNCKTLNFGIPFGLSARNIADNPKFGLTIEGAVKLRQQWLDAVPKVAAYLTWCEQTALSTQPLISPFGLYRTFGVITSANRHAVKNEAKNFAIQSTASYLNVLSAVRLEEPLKQYNASLINLVHDSIMIEAPNDIEIIKKVCILLNEKMTTTAGIYLKTDIPFDVDISYGISWKEQELIMEYGEFVEGV